MKRLWSGIVGLLLAAGLASRSVLAQPGGEEAASWAGRTLRVASGRCPGLDRTAACQAAEQKAQGNLVDALASLAAELSGSEPPHWRLAQEQAWLLAQPGVECKKAMAVEEKEYGPVAVQTIEVRLPQAVLAEWGERLVQQREHRNRVMLGTGGAVGAVLLGGWALLVVLDRATGGYRRRALVFLVSALVILALIGVGTVAGRAWLLEAF